MLDDQKKKTLYYYTENFYYHLEFAKLQLTVCLGDEPLGPFIEKFESKFNKMVDIFKNYDKSQENLNNDLRDLNLYKMTLDIYKRNNIDPDDGKYKYKWMYCIDLYEELLEYLTNTIESISLLS